MTAITEGQWLSQTKGFEMSSRKSVLPMIAALGLSAFSPNAKADTIEFHGSVYARSSMNFDKASARDYWDGKPSNILGVISKGMSAEIVSYRKLPSGNLAARIKMLSGALEGKEVYVYYGAAENKPFGYMSRKVSLAQAEEEAKQPEARYPTPCELGLCPGANELAKQSGTLADLANKAVQNPAQTTTHAPNALSRVSFGPEPRASELRKLTVEAIDKFGKDLVSSLPADLADFCPPFQRLNEEQKKGFWVQLVSGIAREESNYKSLTSVVSSRVDPLTKRPMSKEGLLGLSYYHERKYKRVAPGACDFNHEQDSNAEYSSVDERTSIQNPLNNINCGIGILNYHVKRDRLIASQLNNKFKGGAQVWSSLQNRDPRNRIRALTRQYCASARQGK